MPWQQDGRNEEDIFLETKKKILTTIAKYVTLSKDPILKKDCPKRSLESNQENLVGKHQSFSKIRYLDQFSYMR